MASAETSVLQSPAPPSSGFAPATTLPLHCSLMNRSTSLPPRLR